MGLQHIPKVFSRAALAESAQIWAADFAHSSKRRFREVERGPSEESRVGDLHATWMANELMVERSRESMLWTWACVFTRLLSWLRRLANAFLFALQRGSSRRARRYLVSLRSCRDCRPLQRHLSLDRGLIRQRQQLRSRRPDLRLQPNGAGHARLGDALSELPGDGLRRTDDDAVSVGYVARLTSPERACRNKSKLTNSTLVTFQRATTAASLTTTARLLGLTRPGSTSASARSGQKSPTARPSRCLSASRSSITRVAIRVGPQSPYSRSRCLPPTDFPCVRPLLVLKALINRSARTGLSAVLPPPNLLLAIDPLDRLSVDLQPHMPLTKTWRATDFNLRSVVRSHEPEVDLRVWCLRLIARYQFASGPSFLPACCALAHALAHRR